MLYGQQERIAVTGSKKISRLFSGSTIDRPNRMNHMLGRHSPCRRDDGFARRQTIRITSPPQFPTGRYNIRTARPMNGAIHATSTQQGRVGRIHHSIDLLLGNVPNTDGNAAIEKCGQYRSLRHTSGPQ